MHHQRTWKDNTVTSSSTTQISVSADQKEKADRAAEALHRTLVRTFELLEGLGFGELASDLLVEWAELCLELADCLEPLPAGSSPKPTEPPSS
jgi:hypothetical protein